MPHKYSLRFGIILSLLLSSCINETWGYTRLSSQRIEELLSGKLISNIGTPNVRSRPFREKFGSDFQWDGYYQELFGRQFSGVWSVVDAQLCVQIDGQLIRCRDVWWDESSQTILITDLRNPDSEERDQLVEMKVYNID